MFTFYELLKITLIVPLGPPHSHQSHRVLALAQQLDHLLAEKLTDHFVVVAARHRKLHHLPGVLLAPGSADAVQPRLQRPVVIPDIGVPLRLKLERLMKGDVAVARPTPDRLLATGGAIAQENFHVHHVMLLHVQWLVVVGTVEDQVARPQLRLLQSYRQSVILISLVSAPKGETELHSEVTDGA